MCGIRSAASSATLAQRTASQGQRQSRASSASRCASRKARGKMWGVHWFHLGKMGISRNSLISSRIIFEFRMILVVKLDIKALQFDFSEGFNGIEMIWVARSSIEVAKCGTWPREVGFRPSETTGYQDPWVGDWWFSQHIPQLRMWSSINGRKMPAACDMTKKQLKQHESMKKSYAPSSPTVDRQIDRYID